MNVVLLEKLPNLGEIGQVVKVKSGYARNYLLPFGKASVATAENLAQIEKDAEQLRLKAEQALQNAQQLAEQLKQSSVAIVAAASEEGKLYGSVTNRDIVNSLNTAGMQVDRSQINLDDGPIRTLGKHPVRAILHPDVNIVFDISVTKQK